jgi:DNA polymerase/3'-5' exonuclease PolX
MNKKEIIINNLNKLKNIYENDQSKKWNLKAIKNAIYEISKYDKEIVSGTQLKNEINGIGEKIALRIDEIILNGFLKENNLLINKNPFIDISGVGDVRAKKWLEIGINTIDELKEAINNKKIKSTHHIDIGLKYYNDFKQLIPREEIYIIKNIIKKCLKKIDKKYIFEICGSYRRGCSHSGDVDILITHVTKYEDENHLINIVNALKEINLITDELTINGNTKFMGVCKVKDLPFYRRIDIRFVKYNSYYSSLLYFTGNKNFNILIRKKALSLNMSINEYGIIDNNNVISVYSEKELFDKINMDYIDPLNRNF